MSKLQFDPNDKSSPKAPEWATYIPDRNPQWKVYTQRGHALSSFQYKKDVILYQWMTVTERNELGKWVEVYRIEDWKPDTRCFDCTVSTIREGYGGLDRGWGPGMYNAGRRAWEQDPLRIVTVCDDCKMNRNRRGR